MKSIAARLTAAYAVTATASVAALFGVGHALLERRLIEGSEALTATELARVQRHIFRGPITPTAADLERSLRRPSDNLANIYYVQVRRHGDDAPLFRSRNLRGRDLPIGTGDHYSTTVAGLGDLHIVRTSTPPYQVDVYIAVSLAPVHAAMHDYVEIALLLIGVMLVVSLSSGFWLSQIVLRPLRSIRATTQRINSDTLDERIAVPTVRDELSDLARLLNAMLDRIERSFVQVRRFAADASHELKTPLAILRVRLERLRTDEATDLIAEVDRLSHIVDDLLLLSRLESQVAPVDRKPESIDAFLDSILPDCVALVEHAGLRLDVARHGGGDMRFDPRWIRQVVLNVLTNAIRVSPPGGRITVRSDVTDAAWTVAIDDEGPGVPADRRARIFEPFVRLDAREDGGAGLGLAICRSVVDRHGGTIAALAGVGGRGLTVAFSLPRLPAA